jgi:hypothetical protein
MAGQLLASQRDDKPRAPSVLTYYGEQLEEFAKQRAQMRDAIAKWWTLIPSRGSPSLAKTFAWFDWCSSDRQKRNSLPTSPDRCQSRLTHGVAYKSL